MRLLIFVVNKMNVTFHASQNYCFKLLTDLVNITYVKILLTF